MKQIFDIAKNNPLFEGVAECDFECVLKCLVAKAVAYQKNDMIVLTGEPVKFVGLILSGSVKIIIEDVSGNSTILKKLTVSEIFGEVFAYAEIFHCPVTVQADTDTEILWIDHMKIITSCNNACRFHAKLIKNMLKLFAHKNLALNQKIEILSKRTTREKLFCFFDQQRGAASNFTIPYNREEMAAYLCVDRSAMSGELCKMRDEGLIRFNRNAFELLF